MGGTRRRSWFESLAINERGLEETTDIVAQAKVAQHVCWYDVLSQLVKLSISRKSKAATISFGPEGKMQRRPNGEGGCQRTRISKRQQFSSLYLRQIGCGDPEGSGVPQVRVKETCHRRV